MRPLNQRRSLLAHQVVTHKWQDAMNIQTHRGFVLIYTTVFGTALSILFSYILIQISPNALPIWFFALVVATCFVGGVITAEATWRACVFLGLMGDPDVRRKKFSSRH